MKIHRFEDIIAWQRAQNLAVNVYAQFKDNKDWDFRNQICRASVSISNNIAEGFDRSSNADFRRFLYISLASCSETKSMLYLAQRLNYLNRDVTAILMNQSVEVSKILNGLINSLTPKTNPD
jgi:four helix bundle protein